MQKFLHNNFISYALAFLKWIVLALLVGVVGGVVGSLFHISLDKVTEMRMEFDYLLYFLPLGGLLIAWMYHFFTKNGALDTNRVIESVRNDKKIPLVMTPLIFVSTAITHLLDGSAGREGAALQIGGSIGYNLGKLFKLNHSSLRVIVMTGMSAVFSALFGTPVAAAIFSLEVSTVGSIHYTGIVPCAVSAITAYVISGLFGIKGMSFPDIPLESFTFDVFVKIIILALLAAAVSILFCVAIEKIEHLGDKFFKNSYIRAFTGGLIIVLLTLLVGTRDYNGAGVDVIEHAMNGQANYEAFILKILFTAITISAGFKGGEIVPSFFIGSTFGCVMGSLLGLNPAFGAAIGFISVFCGVVNCPLASIVLSVEIFGAEGLPFFALACAISFMMSGRFSLYNSQKIIYSKIADELIEK